MKRPLAALVAAIAAAAIGSGIAVAQYPPPAESVTLAVSDPTPEVGDIVTITVVVTGDSVASREGMDTGGLLLAVRDPGTGAMEGAVLAFEVFDCTASVSGGVGATVTPSSFSTNDGGVATLSVFTGSQPGMLIVGVNCGTASGQVVLQVGGGATPAPTAPVVESPTAVPTGTAAATPAPPETGSGSDSFGGGDTAWLIGGAVVAIIAFAGATTLMVRRRATGQDVSTD